MTLFAGDKPGCQASADIVQGCWQCRHRKVKCDERKPHCSPCMRTRLGCEYASRLVWVEKDGSYNKSFGRRNALCEETWKGIDVLDTDLVDYLTSQWDPEPVADPVGVISTPLRLPAFNPFGMFRLDEDEGNTQSPLSTPCPISMLNYDPLAPMSLSREERGLFHHYVNHVAVAMMPFEHPRNPWTSSYPARALHNTSKRQKPLFNALLAHAAFSVAHLSPVRDEKMAVAFKYYGLSIRQLMDTFEQEEQPSADVLAVVMTLMMAEIYSGQSKSWKHHFHGAWRLFRKLQAQKPWEESDFACTSFQSLYIINIVGDTCNIDSRHVSSQDGSDQNGRSSAMYQESDSISMIKSTYDFGFTIGAPKVILECISCINDMNRDKDWTESKDHDCQHLLDRLDACRSRLTNKTPQTMDSSEGSSLSRAVVLSGAAYYQHRAFVSAAYIYFYRTIFDLPPRKLEHFVMETFESVNLFISQDCGNLSLWPAFIAAVEAYTEEAMSLARAWLDKATTFGLGSRFLVKTVVEEVWDRRKQAAQELGVGPGLTSVDWRQVMKDLGVDVLLI